MGKSALELKKRVSTTVNDIARLAGVSQSTVSRVLGNIDYPVSNALKVRVIEAAKRLDYTPNMISKALKTGKTANIGVIVPNITNSFYTQLISGIEKVARQHDYNVLLASSLRDQKLENEILKNFFMNQVNAIIISSIAGDARIINNLYKKGVKFLFVEDTMANLKCSKITFDYGAMGYDAVKYLLNLGHKRIGYISTPLTKAGRKKEFEGYLKALEDSSLNIANRTVYIEENEEKELDKEVFEFNVGINGIKELLKRDKTPTAIVAANDMIAIGAMRQILEYGLKIPEDISIIGVDDIPLASLTFPSLTSMHVPIFEVGNTAADIIIQELTQKRNPEELVIKPSLKIRESTSSLDNTVI